MSDLLIITHGVVVLILRNM